MRIVLAAGLLLLGGCGEGGSTPQTLPSEEAAQAPAIGAAGERPAASAAIALDGEGLRFATDESGKGTLLAFGLERSKVEAAVSRATRRSPKRSALPECPAGPTEFSTFGTLQLAFLDGRWISWALNSASSFTTLDGIGIGTTRAQVERTRQLTMIPESSLGEEFVLGSWEDETAIGGIFGEPGPDGRVEYLWAGLPCNFH